MPSPSQPDIDLMPLSNPEEVAQAGVEWWLDRWFEEGDQTRPRPLTIALSGGRIAQTFFDTAAQAISSRGTVLNQTHFFWADERCVPPEDPQSNFHMARQYLLEPLQIPDSNLHRIMGELDPAQAALQAVTDLHQHVPEKNQAGCPVLDLVFLGMGEDGHIASLFPGGAAPGKESDLVYPVIASKPPPQRLTMSYQLLMAAKEVVVLASGKGKEQALHASLQGNSDTPLGKLLLGRTKTAILTDIDLLAS